MKLAWLGQAGYKITLSDGRVIMIDPYMSDSLQLTRGESYRRQVPIDRDVLQAGADILIITHGHADHRDYATLDVLLSRKPMHILTPLNTFRELRERYGEGHDYVMFNRGIELSLGGILFRSCFAAHSDEQAVGVDIFADNRVLSHTGDTLYHPELIKDHALGADALLLPVNGKGCNMNCEDAARLTEKLRPKKVFPMHWDMFKEYGAEVSLFTRYFEGSTVTEAVVPEYYRDTEI